MDMHDLAGAYALNAVSEQEAREFEAHLATCAACQEEVAGYGDVLEALGEPADSDQVAAPAGLHDAVFSEISRTAQDGPARASAATDAQVTDIATMTRRRFAPRFLAAAAAIVLVLAVGVAFLWGAGQTEQNLATDVERVTQAEDAAEQPLGLGDASLWVSATEGVAVTGTTPELDDGQTYQMWVVPADGSAPLPGPTMGSGTGDTAWLTSLDDAAAIAISVEPEGGSTTPTEVVTAVEL